MGQALKPGRSGWMCKLPLLAFLFFLAKGLLWLIVPAVLVALRFAQ